MPKMCPCVPKSYEHSLSTKLNFVPKVAQTVPNCIYEHKINKITRDKFCSHLYLKILEGRGHTLGTQLSWLNFMPTLCVFKEIWNYTNLCAHWGKWTFYPCRFTPRHYICDILPRDILPRGFLPLGCYSALHMWRQGIKGCKVRHKDFVLHDVFSFTFVFTKLLFTTFYPLHCCINHNTLWFMIIQVIKCREVQQFTPRFYSPLYVRRQVVKFRFRVRHITSSSQVEDKNLEQDLITSCH